jgi:TolB-like protein
MKRNVSLVVLAAFTYMMLVQGVLPSLAAEKSKRQYSLAVLDLEVSGAIAPDDAVLMSRQLREDLRALRIFEIMDRPTMVNRLQAAGITEPACGTMACAVRAGLELRVQLVVSGTVRRVGQTFFVDAFMVHVASGEEVQTVTEEFTGSVDELVGFMTVVAKKLVGLPVEEPRRTTTPLRQPLEEEKADRSKLLRYVALGALGAGGLAAIIIATGGGKKGSEKLPDPPAFPSKP